MQIQNNFEKIYGNIQEKKENIIDKGKKKGKSEHELRVLPRGSFWRKCKINNNSMRPLLSHELL